MLHRQSTLTPAGNLSHFSVFQTRYLYFIGEKGIINPCDRPNSNGKKMKTLRRNNPQRTYHILNFLLLSRTAHHRVAYSRHIASASPSLNALSRMTRSGWCFTHWLLACSPVYARCTSYPRVFSQLVSISTMFWSLSTTRSFILHPVLVSSFSIYSDVP